MLAREHSPSMNGKMRGCAKFMLIFRTLWFKHISSHSAYAYISQSRCCRLIFESLFSFQLKQENKNHVHNVPNTIYFNNVIVNGLEQVFRQKTVHNVTLNGDDNTPNYVFFLHKKFIAFGQIKWKFRGYADIHTHTEREQERHISTKWKHNSILNTHLKEFNGHISSAYTVHTLRTSFFSFVSRSITCWLFI